ncbi:MAG: NHL repeat-containing protein [Thermodesulfobacteriota bacterium]
MNYRTIICVAGMLLTGLAFALPAHSAGAKLLAVITGDEFTGMLDQPGAVFFDEEKERLYVADTGNGRLVSFDSKLEYLSELSDDAIKLPSAVVKTGGGIFILVDAERAELTLIDVKNELVEPFPLKGVPAGAERFVPGGLAVDTEDRLYVIDRLNRRILVVADDGSFIREITVEGEGFMGFNDVRVGADGFVYAVDSIAAMVYVFGGEGVLITSFGGRGGEGGLRFPVSLAVDGNGLIYVLDRHAGSIVVFDMGGRVVETLSWLGVKPGELDHPTHIFVDVRGRLFTADGSRVQVFQKRE